MLILYTKPNCAYSAVVKEEIQKLGLLVEERNVLDVEVAEELLAAGGKIQTPYLIDEDTDTAMYESGAIVKYLDTQYGRQKESIVEGGLPEGPGIRLHRRPDFHVCEACE